MKLIELEPHFIKLLDDKGSHQRVDSIAEADGVRFLCPKCFAANHGAVGTHSIICWTDKVPENIEPKPGRWNMQGSYYDDLTLFGAGGRSSSILLTSGCKAHFFVTTGEIFG